MDTGYRVPGQLETQRAEIRALSGKMELKLEVLSSVSIKGNSKKPWPGLGWMQEVASCQLFSWYLASQFLSLVQHQKDLCGLYLFHSNQLCQLSADTGKTSRVTSPLSSLKSPISVIAHSPNGAHLAGLMSSGDVFIWHRQDDALDTHVTPFSKMGVKEDSNLQKFSGK